MASKSSPGIRHISAKTVRQNPKCISFVIPVFNEEEALPMLRARLEALAKKLPSRVEWVFVNDGSRDGSTSILFSWAKVDKRTKILDFSRNFGHQAALTAGVDYALGDVVVIMDADLQDPPELVFQMLEKYREGYDIVYGQRTIRHGEGIFKRATARAFYWLMKRFVHKDLPIDTGDFRLMSRDASNALSQLREGQRFIRGMVTWLGFRQIAVQFERPSRVAGTTKFPLRKMLGFAWDAILSFSTAPLRIGSYLGLLMMLLGGGISVYSLVRKVVYDDLVPGWATLVILNSLLGGAILFCIGLTGEYVGRIYEEIKQRPIYILRRTANISARSGLKSRTVGTPEREAA